MKKVFLLFCLFFVALFSCKSQNMASNVQSDSLYYAGHYNIRKVKMPMRDGVQLYAVVIVPKDISSKNKYPFLMTRTPYNAEDDTPTLFYNASYAKLMREGFVFVFTDVRGRWRSGGVYVNERPEINNPDKKHQKEIDESTDTYDTVDWLLTNIKDNNGRVGVFGVSYPGFYTTTAALSNHPAIKAVSPQAPVTDWFKGDDVHHNGAFFWMDFFTFFPIFENDDPSGLKNHSFGVLPFKESDNYDYFLNKVKTPINANLSFFKDSIPFWNEILNHPNGGEFWKNMDPLTHNLKINSAVLTVGGWYDAEDLYGTLTNYKTLKNQIPKPINKIAMGPWFHGGWWEKGEQLGDTHFGSETGTYYIDSIFIPFMRSHLKENGKDPLAEATVFETGTNIWRKFDSWPPKNTQEESVYLNDGGTLTFQKPSSQNSYSEYLSDPARPVPYQNVVSFERTLDYMVDDQRFADRRPDVVTFQTEPLTENLTLAGVITAQIQASISTSDDDFVVKVIDVLPRPGNAKNASRTGMASEKAPEQGYEHLVRAEIMRGRYRNSLDKPEPFKPGEITPVSFDLPDLFHTFQKGHRIMVQIQSSWFPLVDRNPQQFIDIYHAKPEDYIKSTIRIYHDAAHPSNLVFHVLK
jgi:putative CocE/NonD family hydrolase